MGDLKCSEANSINSVSRDIRDDFFVHNLVRKRHDVFDMIALIRITYIYLAPKA